MFQEICGVAHAKRAAEVAIAGRHAIVFIGAAESSAVELTRQTCNTLIEVAYRIRDTHKTSVIRGFAIAPQAVRPCPCGHWGDTVRECTCSVEMVARHRLQTWPRQADIWCEVPIPGPDQIMRWAKQGLRDGEADQSIVDRIAKAYLFQMPEVPEYTEGAWLMLESATRALFLSPSQVQVVITLSHTIARLAGSAKIDTVHIAEAIQYRPRKENFISELILNDPSND